jgi:hypothetical protein
LSWNPRATWLVETIAADGPRVWVGGDFTAIGGLPRSRIAALDVTTGSATPWNAFANSTVKTLAVSGNTVYAGGAFWWIGGQPRDHIAALDATTGVAMPWDPAAQDTVHTIVATPDAIWVGGDFHGIGGQPRDYLAALDPTSAIASPWDPQVNGRVATLNIVSNQVLVGGSFTTIGGAAPQHLAVISAAVTGIPVDVHTSDSPRLGVTPNPSRGPVEISLITGRRGRLRVKVYDVHGRVVTTLLDEDRGPGLQNLVWAPLSVAPGLYFVHTLFDGETLTRRVAIAR